MIEGFSGKAKGAKVLAGMMSPEERTERAKKAAAARWGAKMPKATHKGNFQEEFGIDIECYVLDDENKTAVIHQRGMGAALGFSSSAGDRFPRFIRGKNISTYIGPELRHKLENPLVFQGLDTISGGPSGRDPYGFDVTILIDVCKAIIAAEADGNLTPVQKERAQRAHTILGASAKAGIKGLVYALSGYDATKEEVIRTFKLYVREEAREYEKEFPDQLYNEWYRLYGIPRPEKNHPWKFAHLTVRQVYLPLAKSNGKIHELIVAQKAASGDRRKKLHQFLADVGVKVLRTHLGQLLGIAQISQSRAEYEKHVNNVFGDQREFDFGDSTSSTEPLPLS